MHRDHSPPPRPDDTDACPCGSGARFGACCGPLLAGARPAATPEALMRSRYCAYVLGDAAYLLATWHPRTRPGQLDLFDQPHWQRLEVAGSGEDAEGAGGWVEFAAHYRAPAGRGCLRERSRFLREQGPLAVSGRHISRADEGRRAGGAQRPLSLRQRAQVQALLRTLSSPADRNPGCPCASMRYAWWA